MEFDIKDTTPILIILGRTDKMSQSAQVVQPSVTR
jgi:hypothetical protein